ncbi:MULTISPECIES: transporter substrate-binding domain-containing protein [Bosea]|uniref:ABC transporter substrate-binding protein n=2 Tax=Bosea TaxID=85413 RepID=A0A1D7U3R8_9HYPH|nr:MULTISPECIES: transporter substrate-binding domain-containing protein [Bosea]AOO81994.1 ABC transporter substrate-binding protein [Bosea vaviloviae]POR46494.1 amino acid ABC transporter substrate-binding protein (PAAT family) [Bosea psychrotolerans]
MIARRDLAGLIGAGAVAATALSLASSSASAQSASQNTFDRVMAKKKLRLGAVTSSAPWFMKDPATGKWAGHFYTIGAALAADMEVELELVETTWGNAVLDLQADKIDIMFGLNPTPKRAMAVDFSGTVYDSALVVIAKPGFEPKSWADMNKPEIKISVDVGSAHDQIASRLCPKAQITRFKTISEAMLALRSGRVDAQCIFWMGGVRAVKADAALGKVIVPQPFFGSTSNAAFRREPDKTWRDFVNTWIVYARGLGLVREAVVSSLEQVGVMPDDLPPGITL